MKKISLISLLVFFSLSLQAKVKFDPPKFDSYLIPPKSTLFDGQNASQAPLELDLLEINPGLLHLNYFWISMEGYTEASNGEISSTSQIIGRTAAGSNICLLTYEFAGPGVCRYLFANSHRVYIQPGTTHLKIANNCINCGLHTDLNNHFKVTIIPAPNVIYVNTKFEKKLADGSYIPFENIYYNGDEVRVVVQSISNLNIEGSYIAFNETIIEPANGAKFADVNGKIYFNLPIIDESADIVPINIVLRGKTPSGVIKLMDTGSQRAPHLMPNPDFNFNTYQVVKNPQLTTPQTFVDLVAGKNADIVLSTAPNINVEGTEIVFKTFDLNGNLITKIFSTDMTTSSTSGEVTIHVDPVPDEPVFLNKIITATVNLKGKGSDGSSFLRGSKDINYKIWKTKKIKLAYLPMIGCEEDVFCTIGFSSDSTNSAAFYGGQYAEAMYPVANEDLSIVVLEDELSLSDDKTISGIGIDLDYLESNLRTGITGLSNLSGLIGVVDWSYFYDHHVQTAAVGAVGIAKQLPNGHKYSHSIAMITHQHYNVLAHELGHTFGLQHSASSDLFDGWINKRLDANWLMPRGELKNKRHIMNGFAGEQFFTNKYWIDSDDYLNLFRKNLDNVLSLPVSLKIRQLKLTPEVGDIKKINTNYEITQFLKYASDIELTSGSSDVRLDVLDVNGNIIKSTNCFDAVYSEVGSISKICQFYVDSKEFEYRFVDNTNQNILKTTYTSLEPLRQHLDRLPDRSILGDLNQFKMIINEYLNKLEYSLKERKTIQSKEVIINQIIPIIKSNVRNNYPNQSPLFPNRDKLVDVAINAINDLKISQNETVKSNGLVSAQKTSSGDRISLLLKKLRKPEDEDSNFYIKVYLNDEIIFADFFNKYSLKFDQNFNSDNWVVKVYLGRTKIIENLKKLNKELNNEYVILENLIKKDGNLGRYIELSKKMTQNRNKNISNINLIEENIVLLGSPLIILPESVKNAE